MSTHDTDSSVPPPPGKPALSKEEIRSLFRELSDGLGAPSARADAPEAEVDHDTPPRLSRALVVSIVVATIAGLAVGALLFHP
jgi:hypothetical protein